MAIQIIIIALLVIVTGLLVTLLFRKPASQGSAQQDAFNATLRTELGQNRSEFSEQAKKSREELAANFKALSDLLATALAQNRAETNQQARDSRDEISKNLSKLATTLSESSEALRTIINNNLKDIREDNSKRLQEMQVIVDEKLQSTLEKRLGESFKLVSERLEMVHKGLGEMSGLATGVGDLKNLMLNIKVRGTWGETQLASLLEQILTREQYATNVATKPNSADRVEFALRLPGNKNDGKEVWLPIDSKFPIEIYTRLNEAYQKADTELVEELSKQMETQIKLEAKKIKEKYLEPPYTTDFGVMFIPVEGLFSEIVRRPGLIEKLQQDRIVVAGPTTFAALLNSLQVGFRTLAIEKRASDVWKLLSAIRQDFGKFGDLLEKTKKKLQETANVIDEASQKSRGIERKLEKVQELPDSSAEAKLAESPLPGTEPDPDNNQKSLL